MRKPKAEEVVLELLLSVLCSQTGNGTAKLLACNSFLLNGENSSTLSATAMATAAASSLLHSTAAPGSSDGTDTTTGASVTVNTLAGTGSGKDVTGNNGNNIVASTDSQAIVGAKAGRTRTSMQSTYFGIICSIICSMG